jgi:hypothetical protein
MEDNPMNSIPVIVYGLHGKLGEVKVGQEDIEMNDNNSPLEARYILTHADVEGLGITESTLIWIEEK